MHLLESLLTKSSSSNRCSSRFSSSISSMDSVMTPASLSPHLPSLLIEDDFSYTASSTKSSRRVFNSAVCSLCDDPLGERLTGEIIIELPCNCAVHQQCLEIMGRFDKSSSLDDIPCPVCDSSQERDLHADNASSTYSCATPKTSISTSGFTTPPLSTASTCSPFSPSPASLRTPESERELRLYPTESSPFSSPLELKFKSLKSSSILKSPVPARSPGHRYPRSSLSSPALLLPGAEIQQVSASKTNEEPLLSLLGRESNPQDDNEEYGPEVCISTDFNVNTPDASCRKSFTAVVSVTAPEIKSNSQPSPEFLSSERAAIVNILSNGLGWTQDRIDSLGELRYSNVLSVSKDNSSWKSLACCLFTSCILCLESPKELRGIIFLQNDVVGLSTLKDQDDYCLQLTLNVESFPEFYLRFISEDMLRMWVISLRKSLLLPNEAFNLQCGDFSKLQHPPLDVVIICMPQRGSISYDHQVLYPLIESAREFDRYCIITNSQASEEEFNFCRPQDGKYIFSDEQFQDLDGAKFLERALNQSVELFKTKGRAQCTRSIIILDNFSLNCSAVGSKWLHDSFYDINIGIHTLGVGLDHNHSLALGLSTCSNGSYTLTRDINHAVECAQRCIKSLQTREFENVSVSLSLPLSTHLRIGKVSGCALDMKRTFTKDKSATIFLGNINRDKRRRQFLVELIISNENGLTESQGSLPLLQADVAYEKVMTFSQERDEQVRMTTHRLNSQRNNNSTLEAACLVAQRKAEYLVSEAFSRACLHLSYGKPERATDILKDMSGTFDNLLIPIKGTQGELRNDTGKRGANELIEVLRCEISLTIALIDKDKGQLRSLDILVKALTFLSCILHSQQCFSASSDLESHYVTI